MPEEPSHAPEYPKARFWSRTLITSVIASTASSLIILYFIQPILGFFWHFVLSNIKHVGDTACHAAALGDTDRYSFEFMAAATILNLGIVSGFAAGKLRSDLKRKTRDDFRPASRNAQQHPVSIRRVFSLRISTVVLAIYVFIAILGGLQALSYDYLVMQLKASFHQRLAVLSPKIPDQAYKTYEAEWARMRNQDDYRRIVEEMESDAKSNGIQLPELLAGARP